MKKEIRILVFGLILFTDFIFAQRVQPARHTLKDLSDPNSPSFVPYPFPKTDFETLEDFKFGVKKMRLYEEPGYDIFLLEKKNVSIGKILKVTQKCMNFAEDYYYLFQVWQNGEIVGEHAVDEFGLVMTGTLFATPEEKGWAKPYKDKNDVKALLDKGLRGVAIWKMDFVFRISDICSPLSPMWEVNTAGGEYYIDYSGRIWTTEYETPVSPEKINRRTKVMVLDEEESKIKFLREICAK